MTENRKELFQGQHGSPSQTSLKEALRRKPNNNDNMAVLQFCRCEPKSTVNFLWSDNDDYQPSLYIDYICSASVGYYITEKFVFQTIVQALGPIGVKRYKKMITSLDIGKRLDVEKQPCFLRKTSSHASGCRWLTSWWCFRTRHESRTRRWLESYLKP